MKSLIKLCLGAAVAVSLSTAAVAGPFTQTDQFLRHGDQKVSRPQGTACSQR